MKYMCVANCTELNDDQHCTCVNIEDAYERYTDGCPCGNKPIWKETKEPNVDIHTAWRDGYDTGSFEAIMNFTGGHKCKYPKAVIYCKDCKYYNPLNQHNYGVCVRIIHDLIMKDDDYCSYAELKEE